MYIKTKLYVARNIWQQFVAIRKSKITLKLYKSAYIGMCILDLTKILMYEFHYDYIKNKYGNKSELLFSDTDGLLYEIKTEDVIENFNSDKKLFDFSSYSTKWKYYYNSNELLIGKMKDETTGVTSK